MAIFPPAYRGAGAQAGVPATAGRPGPLRASGRSGVEELGALQTGQRADALPRLLLGEAKIVQTLQVEPELGAGAEEMGEAQGRIAGDRAGAVEDLRDAVSGHAKLARQLGGAHVERVQFFGQMLSGVDCGYRHDGLRSLSREYLNRRISVGRSRRSEDRRYEGKIRAGRMPGATRERESRIAVREARRQECPLRRAGLAGALGATAGGGDPVEEALHAGAFAPQQGEEFAGVEMRGFVAEKGFHAPLNVRRGPGTQTVAPGDDPVVAESVQHGAETASGRIGAGASGP